jgi:UDPglucose 6-dehydrogenase
MKIGIVGNGFVGRATQIFAKNYFTRDEPGNHSERNESLSDKIKIPFFKRIFFKPITVYIYDIRPEACQPPGITLEDLDRECDLLFFCLPTPLHHDGSCYTQILEDTIARCNNPFKIIRSTIPVGFAAKHGCYFMPEFLTEANWENDFRSTKEWVVGIPTTSCATITATTTAESATTNDSIKVVSELRHQEFKTHITKLIRRSHKNGAIDSSVITFCDTNEAEMLKLMKNCFLSAKVSIMNELYDFCSATRTDYERVATLAKKDQRMGTTHFQVPGPDGRRGFGGTCFPKDTHSLYCQMNAHGVCPHIYPAILARNDTVDRPEREWSRDVWRTTIPLPTPESKVVVVFSDDSHYLRDIISTNLAKNNVVIQVVRERRHSVSHTTHNNLLVQYHTNPNAPLFFPRVDECYYTTRMGDTLYNITREVLRVIDLWNNHEQMTLYVVKQSRNDDPEEEDEEPCNESGTEGFDSDQNDRTESDEVYDKSYYDYAPAIFEEYFTKVISIIPNIKRRLVVLF